MKKFLSKSAVLICVGAAALCHSGNASAAWEQVYSLPTTHAHFITSEGVHLMSDFRDDRQGGIYYSEDKGATWTQTEVKDYSYSNFYEADGYIFAIGSACRIARSEDGGKTWDLLNYSQAVSEWVPEKAIDQTACYGITVLDGVLYAGDFSGGGVIMSEDYGETWQSTDRESLYICFADDPTPFMDCVYHLESFNGKIYCFGMYAVHSYSPETGKWTPEPINSNCMASITVIGDKMICGRAMPNDDPEADYLLATDGETWEVLPGRPDTDSNNVRFLTNDGTYVYSLHNGGPMYYSDNLGESWQEAKGMPTGLYPLTLSDDGEYLYAALYSPVPTNDKSGLWRFPKSELNPSGIKSLRGDCESRVFVKGSMLYCGINAEKLKVFSSDGKCVITATNVSVVDLSKLTRGTYVYQATFAGERVSGKFVK